MTRSGFNRRSILSLRRQTSFDKKRFQPPIFSQHGSIFLAFFRILCYIFAIFQAADQMFVVRTLVRNIRADFSPHYEPVARAVNLADTI